MASKRKSEEDEDEEKTGTKEPRIRDDRTLIRFKTCKHDEYKKFEQFLHEEECEVQILVQNKWEAVGPQTLADLLKKWEKCQIHEKAFSVGVRFFDNQRPTSTFCISLGGTS